MTDHNDPHSEQTTSTPTTRFASIKNLIPVVILLVLFNAAVFNPASIASRTFGVAFLLLVPGAVLLALTPVRPREISVRLSLSVGASLLLLMLLGLLYSLVLPHIGIARPLTRIPVIVGVDIVTLLGLTVQVRHRDPLTYLLLAQPRGRGVGAATILSLLPLAAIAGAERLNNGDGGDVALGVLVAIGVVLCVLVLCVERLPRWSPAMVLYSASAAVLLMTSMRSNYPIGYDIQTEYYWFSETLRSGIWHIPHDGNAYASMLSITILPTTISVATHTSGIYLFKLVYPLIFSFFPVLVYVTAARWFPARAALIGAIVLIVQGYYAADMTGLARQEIALLYFAILIGIAFDESIARRPRQIAAVMAGLGMAISHYSTAYFATTILVFGFVMQLVFRRTRWWRGRGQILLNSPVMIGIVGMVVLWNVVITRSAQNAANLATTVRSSGFQFLSGAPGSSLITRFLNADVTPSVSPANIVQLAVSFYRTHATYLHPYPTAITKPFPLQPISIPAPHTNVPASFGNLTNTATSFINELILLLVGIGIILLLWQVRKSVGNIRAEFGFIALGTIILLAVLRLSATVSTFYNAPRGQVQGAPLLTVGLAVIFAALFTGLTYKRGVFTVLTVLSLGLLFFTDSGLSGLTLGGGAPETLENYGGAYDINYFTTADIQSAKWVAQHDAKGQVVYTDSYGALQLDEVGKLNALATIIPQIIEPGAFVYADAINIVDKTTFASVNNNDAIYRFPSAFLNQVKNVVYSTGTTEVFR